MALVYADRVQELTTVVGTGTMTLSDTVAGWQTFLLGVGTGNTCYYCIVDGTDWEVGLGTFTAGGTDTLTRGAIASSNGGAEVNFPAGDKSVFTVMPAGVINGAIVSQIYAAKSLDADKLNNQTPAYYLARGNFTGTVNLSVSTTDHATVCRLTGVQTLSSKIFTSPKLTSGTVFNCQNGLLDNVKTVSYNSEVANSSSTTVTVNWNSGQKQKLTLSSNVTTVNFTDPPGPCNLMLRVINNAAYNITAWQAKIQFINNGNLPNITDNGVDILAFYFDGTNYHGSFGQNSV